MKPRVVAPAVTAETLAGIVALWRTRPKRLPVLSTWPCGRRCGGQIKCPTGLNRGCIYVTSTD